MVPWPIGDLLAAPWFSMIAVILLTLPYWLSGFSKLLDFQGAMTEAAQLGLKPVWAIAALTILVQLAGPLSILTGHFAWLGAGALGVFTLIATLIAHPFWQIREAAARAEARNSFMEHIGLIGGLMLAAIVMR